MPPTSDHNREAMCDSSPPADQVKVPKLRDVTASLLRLWARLRACLAQPEKQIFWGIVLLAAALRLGYLDLIEFKADEAHHLLRGLEIVESHKLPLAGTPSSLGVAKPPLMSYLLAIPLLFGRDPRIASAFIALLNVAAIAGCYLVCRRYYGLRVAIIASVLMAANPWAVVFSRKAFTADVLAPFLVLFHYGLCVALLDRKPWGWVCSCVALGLALNVTFSPLPLIAVLVLLVVLFADRVRWRYLLLGVGLVLVISAPYLYYQATHRLEDVRSLLRELGQEGATARQAIRAVRFAAWIHSGQNLSALAGASAAQFSPAHSLLADLNRAAGWIFLASLPITVWLALRAWSHWRERQDPAKYAILAVWLWVSLLVVSRQPAALEPHYLVILYPAGFVGMGLVMDLALNLPRAQQLRRLPGRRVVELPVWLLLFAVVVWQAYDGVYLFQFVARHDTSGGYGTPFRFWRHTADLVRRQVRAVDTDQVWVVTQGTDISYQEHPAVLHYLLEPEVRTVFLGQGGDEAILLPAARPGVYLLTRSCPLVEGMIQQLGGQNKGHVLLPDGESGARVKVVEAQPVEEVLSLIGHRGWWILDSGSHLLGYDWPAQARAGQSVAFASYWAFLDIPPEEKRVQHSLFNHLLAPDGTKVAQRDGLGLPERYWGSGLVLLQWFEMPLPPDLPTGEYTLLMGMYRADNLQRNRHLDQVGNPLGDSISLGPVRVGP